MAAQERQLESGAPEGIPFHAEGDIDFHGDNSETSIWQGTNQVVRRQKEMAMDAAMNINLPAARGIINPHNNSTANIKIAYQRKNASPLGNFWRRNLEDVFKDF